MAEFVVRLDLRHDEPKLERLLKEYKEAKAALQAYLFSEGCSFKTAYKPKPEEQQETASGN